MKEMITCSSGHVEIVHTEGYKNCPMCSTLKIVSEVCDILNDVHNGIIYGNDKDTIMSQIANAMEQLNTIT